MLALRLWSIKVVGDDECEPVFLVPDGDTPLLFLTEQEAQRELDYRWPGTDGVYAVVPVELCERRPGGGA